MDALRAHTTTGPRVRFSPVREPDRIALRWQRRYADAAAFWRKVGPTINAAVACGFDRRDLLPVLERALDNGGDVLDALADELADAIEAQP